MALKVLLSIESLKYPLTGIGRYTYELAVGLQQHGLESLKYLRGGQVLSSVPNVYSEASGSHMSEAAKLQSSRLLARANAGLRRVPGIAPLRSSYGRWRQSSALRDVKDHLFHGPNYAIPLNVGPSVVTIHDLSVFCLPGSHPADRVKQVRQQIEQALERASAVITDTHYTRQEVMSYFALPPERVHAVHLASASDFYPRPDEALVQPLQLLGLTPAGYTLFVGTIEPRKNLDVLLEAYERLPVALRARWPLVISGDAGWSSAGLHARMERAQRQGWLTYVGYVPQTLLACLVAGARLFAYPSLYEGFGLPVLEAAACGVPVVCSNASCLPEVGGSAFAYHDPEDVDQLCSLLEQGLTEPGWRGDARRAGLARAQEFSWERCVQETLSVYKSIC